MDLQRGGITLIFSARRPMGLFIDAVVSGLLAFEDHADAVDWCKSRFRHNMPERSLVTVAPSDSTRKLPGTTSTDNCSAKIIIRTSRYSIGGEGGCSTQQTFTSSGFISCEFP